MPKGRAFSLEFKLAAVQRILKGESVTALCRELGVKRGVLYRWRDTYKAEGEAGLKRAAGRRPGNPAPLTLEAQRKALERKLKQQELEIEFLKRCIEIVTGKKPPEPN